MRNNIRVFVAITMLVLGVLACSIPGGGPLLEDDFSGNDTNWGTGTYEESSVEYKNDMLNFFVNKDFYFVWSTPGADDYESTHIEVTAKNQSSDSTGAFGIVCNLKDVVGTSYYFAVTGAGEYAIGRYSLASDEILTNDGKWGTADAIASDAATYRIGADCGNETFTLYVDGQKIDSVTDTYYTSGKVGLFAWSGEQLDGTDVSFDDFVVTKLGK